MIRSPVHPEPFNKANPGLRRLGHRVGRAEANRCDYGAHRVQFTIRILCSSRRQATHRILSAAVKRAARLDDHRAVNPDHLDFFAENTSLPHGSNLECATKPMSPSNASQSVRENKPN